MFKQNITHHTESSHQNFSVNFTIWSCALIIVLGGVGRVLGCFTDLWFDEIWSHSFAKKVSSPIEIFTAIRHGNNNYLLTLYYYFLGDDFPEYIYRIPSLLTGVGTTILAAVIGYRHGRIEAVFTAFLTSFCFALIHFSSEARGYSPSIFFAFLGYWVLDISISKRKLWTIFLFWLSIVSGFLFHSTFIFFYAATVVYSAWKLVLPFEKRTKNIIHFIKLHFIPVTFVFFLYFIDIRYYQIVTANPVDYSALISEIFGYTFGLPIHKELAITYLIFGLIILSISLLNHMKQKENSSILIITILLAPILAVIFFKKESIYVRYFLTGISFSLLLIGQFLAHLYRKNYIWRGVSICLLILFFIGNTIHTVNFLKYGRGGYEEALLYMESHSAAPFILVSSSHDFRVGLVLDFYKTHLISQKKLAYVSKDKWSETSPEWFIDQHGTRPKNVALSIVDYLGNSFELQKEFDQKAMSGFYWALYKNARYK